MCWGGGRIPPRRTPWHYMDQNLQRLNLRFYRHPGDWRAAGVPRMALELNCPPFIIHGGQHPGNLSADFSAVSLAPANVLPLAIKPPGPAKEPSSACGSPPASRRRRNSPSKASPPP